MLRDHRLGVVAVALDRLGDVARPQPAVAHLGAADGVEIVHGVGGVFRHVQHPELRKVQQHLGRRLRARHQMEFDLDAVDPAGLVGCLIRSFGGISDSVPRRQRLAEPGIDLAALARGAGCRTGTARGGSWHCRR